MFEEQLGTKESQLIDCSKKTKSQKMKYAKLAEKKETDIEVGCISNDKLRNRLYSYCNWGILLIACFVLLCVVVKLLTVFHEFDHT